MHHKILVMAIVFWSLLIIGCGYHFRTDGKPEGINIPSLAIPMMESTSSALGFENDFTEAIRSEFISHGDITLVSIKDAAMVLIGSIREIKSDPLTYDVNKSKVGVGGETTYYEVTDSRRMRVSLDAKLIDRSTGKTIWEEKGMEEQARYLVTKDPRTNNYDIFMIQYNQKKAIQKIAGRLVDRIYLRTMERF